MDDGVRRAVAAPGRWSPDKPEGRRGRGRAGVVNRSTWLVLVIAAGGVQAGDWEITPAVSVGGVYTSNVGLEADDERD